MRSFEVITSVVNRSDGRLPPTQLGAAFIPGDSACFPGDPDIIVAKVNRFSFVGRSFKQSVYICSWVEVFKKSQSVAGRKIQPGAP
jgi:hypothetical protein